MSEIEGGGVNTVDKEAAAARARETDFEVLKAQLPANAKPIEGPSALTGETSRTLHLTWVIAVTDFKLKFFGSVLGYLWQLLRPLMMFGVLLFVFTQFFKVGSEAKDYPAILLSGLILYGFFAESTDGAVTAVLLRENLVRKIRFPRIVIPLATVVTAFLNLLVNFIAIAIFFAAMGIQPQIGWLGIPLLLLVLALFATGLAAMLSGLYVRYRDIQPIWGVVLQVMFYGSPIMYPIEAVAHSDLLPPAEMERLMLFNPLAVVLQQFRHWVVDPTAPDAAQVMGGTIWLLVPLAIFIATIVIGFKVFDRQAKHVAEDL